MTSQHTSDLHRLRLHPPPSFSALTDDLPETGEQPYHLGKCHNHKAAKAKQRSKGRLWRSVADLQSTRAAAETNGCSERTGKRLQISGANGHRRGEPRKGEH